MNRVHLGRALRWEEEAEPEVQFRLSTWTRKLRIGFGSSTAKEEEEEKEMGIPPSELVYKTDS